LLGNLRGIKSKTEVRKDPENPHLVYASVDKSWVSCFSSHARRYETLDLASQFSEGLTISEARIARKKIAENADVDLARIIREMDAISESGENVIPIINFEIEDEEDVSQVSIFEKIKNTVVRELSTGVW
jgi:putative transposase